MATKRKPKTKDGCDACGKLLSTQLFNHCRQYHTDFKAILVTTDGRTLEHIIRSTDKGFICPYSCGASFITRNSCTRHLNNDTDCQKPECTVVKTSQLDETPSFPMLKDISNVTRALMTYDEAIISTCPTNKTKEAEGRRMINGIQSLDLVPFGIHNNESGEETSFTSEEKLDTIIEKFHGKVVHISRKCPEMETVDDHSARKKIKPISTDDKFSTTVLNGPYAKTMKDRAYFELNDDISELLNTCWISTPQIKYFSCKALAGAILFNLETTEALLILSVELYGRTATIDPHFERDDASLPPKNTKYKEVWPTTLRTSDGTKLIIGTKQTNYLVTGSIRVDKKLTAEVGPSTLNFKLQSRESSRSTSLFLDQKVYEEAKRLGEDNNCNGVEVSHCLYQLRQIRSKFNEIESYYRLRAASDLITITKELPVSVFTLCNYPKAIPSNKSEDSSNYALGSKLFMKIASEVLSRNYNAKLTKGVVESIMLQFKNKTQKIPKIIKDILDLFEDGSDEIRILYNNDLNRQLVNLAGLLASQITKANEDVIESINTVMTNI